MRALPESEPLTTFQRGSVWYAFNKLNGIIGRGKTRARAIAEYNRLRNRAERRKYSHETRELNTITYRLGLRQTRNV